MSVTGYMCLDLFGFLISDILKIYILEKSFIHVFPVQAYQRGAVPKSRILPAGGKVLTSEEEYNLLSDKHFPDPIGELLCLSLN